MNKIYAVALLTLSLLGSHIYPVFPSPQNALENSSNARPTESLTSIVQTPTGAISGQKPAGIPNSTSSVFAYITEQAKKAGINPIDIQWIAIHESQLGQNLVGDDGDSLGYFMVDSKYHPEVSRACALSLQCSTAWSLPRIKSDPDMWSTFACRYVWFYKDAVATFGLPPTDYVRPRYCKSPL